MQRKLCAIAQGSKVDFAILVMNSVLNLPSGQVKFFGGIQILQKNHNHSCCHQNVFQAS